MRRLKDVFNGAGARKKTKIVNERQFINSQFIERLEEERARWAAENGKKHKALPMSFYASKNAIIAPTTKQLKTFFDECTRAANFSAYWWWRIRQDYEIGEENESEDVPFD